MGKIISIVQIILTTVGLIQLLEGAVFAALISVFAIYLVGAVEVF